MYDIYAQFILYKLMFTCVLLLTCFIKTSGITSFHLDYAGLGTFCGSELYVFGQPELSPRYQPTEAY